MKNLFESFLFFFTFKSEVQMNGRKFLKLFFMGGKLLKAFKNNSSLSTTFLLILCIKQKIKIVLNIRAGP